MIDFNQPGPCTIKEYLQMTPASPFLCFRCGWKKTRPSLSIGAVDRLVRLLGLYPIRCERCGNRFYRFKRRAFYFVSLGIFALLIMSALAGLAYWTTHRTPQAAAPAPSATERTATPTAGDLQR